MLTVLPEVAEVAEALAAPPDDQVDPELHERLLRDGLEAGRVTVATRA